MSQILCGVHLSWKIWNLNLTKHLYFIRLPNVFVVWNFVSRLECVEFLPLFVKPIHANCLKSVCLTTWRIILKEVHFSLRIDHNYAGFLLVIGVCVVDLPFILTSLLWPGCSWLLQNEGPKSSTSHSSWIFYYENPTSPRALCPVASDIA